MIGKKRGKTYPVYVYDPRSKKKRYVGACEKLADARELEAAKERQFRRGIHTRETGASYAEHWFTVHHGAATKRPAPATLTNNRTMLKPFLAKFGDRYLADIPRREALAFARQYPHAARVAAAMYADALDEQHIEYNPFANRRQPQARGRRDITPLTETEIECLGDLALSLHVGYGATVKAWIYFAAWVGARPGEYFALTWDHLDLDAGTAEVTRIKGDKQTEKIVVPDAACDAIRAMNSLRRGLVFTSPTGKPIKKGLYSYYWNPVRVAFAAQLDPARWRELFEHRKPNDRDIDLYELRHFCGSIMADRGLTEFDIAKQLGNGPVVCRETYIHTHVDRANDRIRAALNQPAAASLDAARDHKIRGSN